MTPTPGPISNPPRSGFRPENGFFFQFKMPPKVDFDRKTAFFQDGLGEARGGAGRLGVTPRKEASGSSGSNSGSSGSSSGSYSYSSSSFSSSSLHAAKMATE
jgi:hypothetical protein